MRLAAIVLVTAWASTAQAEAPPETVVLADLGLHVIGAGVQRTVAPRVAVQGALEFYSPWAQNLDVLGLRDDDVDGDVRGAAIRVRVFGYLGAAPTGWWLSPFAQAG
ncbi:MAG: hypothetical protein H0T79_15580, partial [Deltaproteobacteria bacterium]|nr:hypothetical protein [Deltaproteobacteria bacterium]